MIFVNYFLFFIMKNSILFLFNEGRYFLEDCLLIYLEGMIDLEKLLFVIIN